MNADFTHLHVHSSYSLLDSCVRIDDLIQAAVDDKMEAIALTDHGNMFGSLDFYSAAKEHGIKPIIGCEVYMAPGSRLMRATHMNDDAELAPYAPPSSGLNHLVLLCQNQVGYQNLCHLVSSGFLEGFYYRPRIDKEILQKHSEGLIATSACLKGEIASLILRGDMDTARESVKWYQSIFKDRYYFEIEQNGLPHQMMVNQKLLELAEELKVPIIGTSDVHYIKKEDAFSQEVLLHIQTGKPMEDKDPEAIPSSEFYFKPQSVIREEFSAYPEAISNTMKIASECNFEFKFKDESGKKIYHFPNFEAPDKKKPEDYINELALEGLKARYLEIEELRKKPLSPEEKAVYEARLDKELKVINNMGFTGYFLIVSDFIRHAKGHEIPVGPGRGSGAGSLVAYSLNITDLDPLEHGLLFERFLNPERVSLPDFDVDFCMDKREQIIEYVSQKYGKECVAQIITFGKLQARGVIRDVGRVFGMMPFEVDKIAKLVPEVLNITLDEALEQEPRLKQLTETDPQIHHLFQVALKLEGLFRHASIHAAGIVISNRPMVEHCPLYRGKNNELVIQYDMNNADKIGLIKFDFLGLKTLTFLEKAEKLINVRHPEADFKVAKIPIIDTKMYEMLAKGDTLGVFQLESSGMQDLLKRARPNVFADIVAINALYRPGPMGSGMLDDFIGRKHGDIPVTYDFNELKETLQETYGVIVYQEQVQQIAMRLAGYTAGGADLLRRAMGKKKPEEMAKQKQIFVDGATANKFDKAKVEHLFDLMEKFAGYGFNKSHAAAYSLVTCQTAFIKAHYPVEFFATLLSIERENTDKITRYIADSKKHGIAVLAPDINESETDFTVLTEQKIRFGLGAIKGVGQIAIDSVLEARQKGGPFKDLFDFCSRINTRTVNKRVLEAFVKAGAFDTFGVHRASIFAAIDDALEAGTALQKVRDDKQNSFADLFDEESTFNQRKVSYPEKERWPKLFELKNEKETIGFFVTGHPLDDFEKELARYTTTTISACMTSGGSKDVLIAGELVAFREIITKKGDRMAFATLEDKTEQIECVIFSDAYLESELVWKSGEPIWVKGQLEVGENNSRKLLLSKKSNAKVLPLRYAYETLAREVRIQIPYREKLSWNAKKVEQLQLFLKGQHDPKGAPIYLSIETFPKTFTILKMKETVLLKRDNINYIQDLFKDEKAEIDFR